MQSDIMIRSRLTEIRPEDGPDFEMRTYTYLPARATITTTGKRDQGAAAVRARLRGLVLGAGLAQKFVHIWPYQSLDSATRSQKTRMRPDRACPQKAAERGVTIGCIRGEKNTGASIFRR